MGYTHYFQLHTVPTESAWTSFSNGAKQLAQASGVKLTTEFNNESVVVNGVAEGEHETLFVSRTNTRWEFCKTNFKPYDEVVTSILILAKYMFPDMYLNSDGDWSEWRKGRELFTDVFHLDPAKETIFDGVQAVFPERTHA